MRFAKGEIYHIYNKAIAGHDLFNDHDDYERFLLGLSAFNNIKPITLKDYKSKNPAVRPLEKEKENLVSVLNYILMKNHVHLLIQCIDPDKISKYLQKIFGGYTCYFNIKYNRSGVIFQGKSKSKHINNPGYLEIMLNYIPLNALDYNFPEWRQGKIKDKNRAEIELTTYPWSGLAEIIGRKPAEIIDKNLVKDFITDSNEFLDSLLLWSSKEYEAGKNLFIE